MKNNESTYTPDTKRQMEEVYDRHYREALKNFNNEKCAFRDPDPLMFIAPRFAFVMLRNMTEEEFKTVHDRMDKNPTGV